MAEVSGDELRGRNAVLVWDGLGTIQLRYEGAWIKQKSTLTHLVLKKLGERTVPIEAVRDVELVMPGGHEDPTIRLVLRDHADPLLSVAGGALNELIDPYRFDFDNAQWLLADYYAQEIRTSIALHQLGSAPADRWLVEAPPAPTGLKGQQGMKLALEGDELVFDYGFATPKEKKAYGDPWRLPVAEVVAVEWQPITNKWGSNGYLRITSARTPTDRPEPAKDPETLVTQPLAETDALFFGAKLLSMVDC
ncbi:DUF4429 domain-containing protein [Kribbella sp. NPDC026611]|uniref:DUF4429 domain-containing protein n=1 Tax=Kribbella sp. NPDC026611 TaxID=3154911 RepID=UPI0034027179